MSRRLPRVTSSMYSTIEEIRSVGSANLDAYTREVVLCVQEIPFEDVVDLLSGTDPQALSIADLIPLPEADDSQLGAAKRLLMEMVRAGFPNPEPTPDNLEPYQAWQVACMAMVPIRSVAEGDRIPTWVIRDLGLVRARFDGEPEDEESMRLIELAHRQEIVDTEAAADAEAKRLEDEDGDGTEGVDR